MKLKKIQLAAILYAILIFALSHQEKVRGAKSGESLIPEFIPFDKLFHFFEYFLFGILLLLSFEKGFTEEKARKQSARKRRDIMDCIFFSTIAGGVWALTDEIHQYFVPGRTFSLADWVFDFLGLSFGIILIIILQKRFSFSTENSTQ